ncbi:hypothetical protein V5799_004619 [Amblyomma americanum]|uniref:BTB domain-containing protein n=1 Tax=Amblyomma americanum TaxID=6943 RepID=A0AAQ4D5K6_AMBAM
MQLSLFCEALWLKHQLTDVEVQVETEVFPAHKLVLTCHSPYFHKLLINTKPEMLKVQLNGITHESFSVLLEYMYTGRLQLTCQNIVDVFQASKHLDMKRIKERCAQIPTADGEEAAEQWLGDPLLHEMLHSRALNERTRVVEWDEYAAKVLPEDSRIRRGSPGVLLVGGIDPHLPHQVLTGCAVLAYEETDDRWHRVAMLPEPRHHHAGAIVGDNVYVIGERWR